MFTERDNEEFKGRFWTGSFLPQYFISAILVGALTVIFESDDSIFTVRFLENGGWVNVIYYRSVFFILKEQVINNWYQATV
jgi:hypothetical protein